MVALRNKVADSEGVLVGIAAGEALVGHVNESKVTLLLDEGRNFLPLLGGRVDARGVVGAGVEEKDAASGRGLDVGHHALKVEANGILVVVAVLPDGKTGVGEDGLVVGPRGRGNVNILVALVETLEESGTDTQGTGAGDGLSDSDAVEGWGVGGVGEFCGQGRKLGDTGDASVLLVQLGVDDPALSLADRGQDKGLALVIAVCTDT